MSAKVNPQEILRKARSTTSRRAQYSASTQRALIDVARDLFSRKGYAGTSLDEIVAGARVTKGALYHHFSGKQALFEAVFDRVEEDASKRVRKAMRDAREPWDKAQAALRAFFKVARGAEYRRIVVQEGPVVLGYERFREQEERSMYRVVQEIVDLTLPGDTFPARMTVPIARLFFGAVSAAATSLSIAEDPERESVELEEVIEFLVAGVRQQVASVGVVSPSAEKG